MSLLSVSALGAAASVVMIGNSLIGMDNPVMLQQLLAAGTGPAAVEAQIINGAPLSYNWQHGDKAEGIDARARLQEPVDALILAEAIPLSNHLRWSHTEDTIASYYDLAAQSNPAVTLWVQEGWHSLLSGTGTEVPFDAEAATPWRDRLSRDLPRWQGVVDKVRAQTGGDIRLLPVGQALGYLSDEIDAGRVSGIDRINALFSDDIHLTPVGVYYVSLVQYGALSGQSPVGLPERVTTRWGQPYALPEPELARRLQEVAAEALDLAPRAPLEALPVPPERSAAEATPEPAPPLRSPVQPLPQMTQQPVGMNLAPVHDWSPGVPFMDLFKTARPWIGHLPGQWGGIDSTELAAAGYLDENGWPTAVPPELGSIGTVILTDLDETAIGLSGRYVLLYEGDGIVEVACRARNVRYGPGTVAFDFSPGPGAVDIRIQRSDRAGNGDYLRNIRVVRERDLDAFAAGALFNPDYLDRIEGFAVLRFMDWMDTNDSRQIGWEDRPRPDDYTWASHGIPAEVMIALANRIGADPWMTLPHMADDTYVRNLAQMVRDGLDEDLSAYVEYSNEVWNSQFTQFDWAEQQGEVLWGKSGLGFQYYGGRAAEIGAIWQEVFAATTPAPLMAHRLRRVISMHTGWLGLESQMLEAPLWTAADPARRAPWKDMDVYAVTAYIGGHLGTLSAAPTVRAWIADSQERARSAATARFSTPEDRASYYADHRFDIAVAQAAAEIEDGLLSDNPDGSLRDVLTRLLPYHHDIAKRHGLDLVVYEGGSHVVAQGGLIEDGLLTEFFTHLNYTPEMGQLYARLLNAMPQLGVALFTAYSDVTTPGKWGSWGALRHLADDNPRWQVLQQAR